MPSHSSRFRRCPGLWTLAAVAAACGAAVVLGCVLAVGAASASEGYFPPGDARAGGIRDLMLIYLGGDHWKQEEFLPYVAYLGKGADKRAKDWFYDSYLFLAYGGAPSGTAYYDGPTVKTDWEFYYEMLFRNDRALRALEACIHDVAKTLGQPPRETPVILMIPYLSPRQRSFGDVDGDGASEDLSKEADREKVVTWCVDELCRRWEKAGFTSLKLWGFYWMNEDIGPEDEALIRSAAAYVHRRGYGLHWIPYYRAAGVDKAYPLGFDFVIQQPNYAFMEQHGQRPEAQRLIDTAEAARRRQMGIEIEMPDRVLDRQDRRNLLEYLVYGRDEREGYMRGAVHGYYQSTGAIARLCYSDVPAERALYDALYEFAKGRFQGDTPHPFPACTYRVDARVVAGLEDDGRKLTDGLWASRESQIQRRRLRGERGRSGYGPGRRAAGRPRPRPRRCAGVGPRRFSAGGTGGDFAGRGPVARRRADLLGFDEPQRRAHGRFS